MPPLTNATSSQPTSFVNGLAWSFIGLTALSALLAAVLYTLFTYVVPIEALRGALADAINLKLLPPSALKAVAHLSTLFIALFAASLLTLLVCIALLRRRNWARITFAWIMIATAIAHIAGLLLPFYFMHDFSVALNEMPPALRGVASTVTGIISVMSIVMGIAFACFFAWVAKRLLSAEIKQKFLARNATEYR